MKQPPGWLPPGRLTFFPIECIVTDEFVHKFLHMISLSTYLHSRSMGESTNSFVRRAIMEAIARDLDMKERTV